ncbi:putative fimbrial protein TcfA [Cedecea lapagei]|uniref:Putative fimbrial protein TcfA n=1 Tax=Cedecea lapagei TaxID=158823 RepID=A0A3S4K0F9_9ENTR|nr:fimbrial protein [Cedecea lapagei]VEB99020.1 putative fimbrial protein TcfA [Cedecea lapagei]
MTTAFYLAALPLSFFSEMAMANMSVYPMELNVDSSGTAQIKVASKTDDIQFIRVRQKKILNPGTPEEKEIDVASWKEGGVVVTPEKFALSAGAMRVVRLVSLMPPAKETTWRVYFESVKQPDSIIPGHSEESGATAKLGVNVIWGALVHLAPEKSVVSLSLDPERGTLKNSGTLRVPLREIGICHTDVLCKWVKEDATIYPDTERKLKTLTENQDKKYKFRYFNWVKKTIEEANLPVVK